MKSVSQLRSDYGVDTKNTSNANLSYGLTIMNDFYRTLLAKADWPFLHRLRTATTQASTTFVNLPYDVDLIESVFVTVGSTRHSPTPAPSRKFWDELHYTSQTSDIPRYWFQYNGQIGLWPQPQTAGNIISINCKVRVADLSVLDTTGSTISSVTVGSTNMILSGGVTNQMAGFWVRPTLGTATNTGDGLWYEIASVASGTALTLTRSYGGVVSISAATAACTISQLPLLPEAFQNLPEIYAAHRYWSKEKDSRADAFKSMLTDGISTLFTTYGLNDLSMVVDDGDDAGLINPNLTISL